jgi:hypothetical protein
MRELMALHSLSRPAGEGVRFSLFLKEKQSVAARVEGGEI